MKKSTFAKIGLYLVVILVFNVVYFNMISNHTPARWVSYAGIHLSYLLLCASSLSFDQFGSGGSVVHVYPKMMVANGYFVTSLIFGAILILINNSTITFPVIVHAIIIGFYLFHYLLLMNAEAYTEANTQRIKQGMFFIRDCSSRIRTLMNASLPREVYDKVERFHDALNAAMPSMRPETAGAELRISELVAQVEKAVRSGNGGIDDLVQEAIALLRERDRMITLYR